MNIRGIYSTHLAADPRVSSNMRHPLNAVPGSLPGSCLETGIDLGLRRPPACLVTNAAVDTVVPDLVAGAQRVGVAGKGASGYASVGSTIPAEAEGIIEEN